MTTITVHKPAAVRVPRAAPFAASLFIGFLEMCKRTLASSAQPTKARTPADRNAEAVKVRRYADSIRAGDPRYAADLYAAADQHELTG